jgi:cytochrome P450
MARDTTLQSIYDFASRADPYPLFAELRETPVSWQQGAPQETGTYVVSTYREIEALLHDPRISSDLRKGARTGGARTSTAPYSFINLDPPEHDRLRRLATRHFGPPARPDYVEQLRPDIARIAAALVDGVGDERRIDLVARVAYPLPVSVICAILGVPPEDQRTFRVWADALIETVGTDTPEARAQRENASLALNRYVGALVERRRKQPTDDLFSRMATDTGPDGRMEDPYLVATAALLLVAGHETTVNLIANGMLTLLRHPAILERLRREPDRIASTVEELLRYEPPVQMLPNRTTLEDVTVAGITIPKGVLVTLALAAGNRDPLRFRHPDRFDPERRDNAHLGFGSGIHYCFGAPLARIEGQIALLEMVRRLERPRLVVDPPPFRTSAVLRGPAHLLVEIDRAKRARQVAPLVPARSQ